MCAHDGGTHKQEIVRVFVSPGVGMSEQYAALPDPKTEIYPRAPLRAVAIELNFKPLLDAVQRFGAFQRRHSQTFTRTRLADPEESRDANLLLDEAGSRGVGISPSSLSFVTYSYDSGFEGFTEWSEPLMMEALDLLELSSFSDVAYRYENVVEMKIDQRVMSVEDILRFQMPKHPSVAASPPSTLVVTWTQSWPRGEVTVDVGCFGEPSVHTHVDISARCKGPLTRDELVDAIREAHRMGRLTFEEMITSDFREQLRRVKA
jgi:uncharacterized protein (TIGR04255 family)